MSRTKFEIPDLLTEIEGSPDGVGYDLVLSPVYDNIKNARFEEDASVSFGIWEHELKKADWALVEKLAVDAVRNKSKDLQIVGWLIEAMVVLDGFEGVLRGINVLSTFVKQFWATCYPRNEDNSSDIEQKQIILEWIFDTVGKKSLFIPFAWYNGSDAVNLYNYEYAVDMKNATIRAPNSSAQILESAKKSGAKNLEEVLNIVSVMPHDDAGKILKLTRDIKKSKAEFDATLVELAGGTQNTFSGLITNLEKIEKLLSTKKNSGESKEEAEQLPECSDTGTRDNIYDQISSLSKKLAAIEKHSPSSFILDLVVSWRNKTLLEIMDDLKSGKSDAHKLLKFLLS